MRWVISDPTERHQNWNSWFAWHPVTVGNVVVWLERVERKGTPIRGWGDDYWVWEYRYAA